MQLNSQTPVTEVRIVSKQQGEVVRSFWFVGAFGDIASIDRALTQTLFRVVNGGVPFSLSQFGNDLAMELSERCNSVTLNPIPSTPAVRVYLLFGDTEEDLDVQIDVFRHDENGYAKRDDDQPKFSQIWDNYSSLRGFASPRKPTNNRRSQTMGSRAIITVRSRPSEGADFQTVATIYCPDSGGLQGVGSLLYGFLRQIVVVNGAGLVECLEHVNGDGELASRIVSLLWATGYRPALLSDASKVSPEIHIQLDVGAPCESGIVRPIAVTVFGQDEGGCCDSEIHSGDVASFGWCLKIDSELERIGAK